MLALGSGELNVLQTSGEPVDARIEAEEDRGRINRWFKGGKWRVEEGFNDFRARTET